jgi:serine/threonine protein phosphatase PrpC
MTQIGRNEDAHSITVPGHDGRPVTLAWAAITDTGRRRQQNQDSVLARPPYFVVADGMGGHAAGDVASDAVVQRLDQRVAGEFAEPADLIGALYDAAVDIADYSRESALGTGTTVTGAVLTLVEGKPQWLVFNIGDSRVYAQLDGVLSQVTVDHSVVQQLVDAGTITKEQAEQHPDSNMITRAVGFNELPSPDYWMLPVLPGLRLLVCSDGLTKEVRDEEIALHLRSGADAASTARTLVQRALELGGRDNVTVIVLDVLGAPESDEGPDGASEDTRPRSRG